MRKFAFGKGDNEGADQLRDNCAADQHLCFRYYIDSTIPLLHKSKISSPLSSVVAQFGNLEDRFSRDTTHMPDTEVELQD